MEILAPASQSTSRTTPSNGARSRRSKPSPGISPQLREYWRQLASDNAAYLGRYILDRDPPPLHLEWQALADIHPNLVIIGPVLYGKSEQFSLLRPLHELGHDPDLRIGLVGETEAQGKKWLSKIKSNIVGNPRLREIYPHLKPGIREGRRELWQEKAILVQRSEMASRREKDPSIQAIGIGGQIIGARLDRVYIDDMVTLRNALSDAGRESTDDWFFGALLGRLSEYARIVFVNNPWHDLDLMHKLEREFGDVYKVVRYAAGEPNCQVPWWTIERLEEKRLTMPALDYARQFLCVPFTNETGLLPVNSIRRCQALTEDPADWWGGGHVGTGAIRFVTAGVDLGGTDRATGSLTAIAVAGIDGEERKHLLHVRSGHWLGLELIRQMIDVHRAHRPNEWVVETNGVQLHLAHLLQDPLIVRAAGATVEEAAEIRVLGQYTTQTAKNEEQWGIRAMGGDFDAGRYRIPKHQREVEEAIREAQRFSPVGHTGDRLIAWWLADRRLKGAGNIFFLRVASR